MNKLKELLAYDRAYEKYMQEQEKLVEELRKQGWKIKHKEWQVTSFYSSQSDDTDIKTKDIDESWIWKIAKDKDKFYWRMSVYLFKAMSVSEHKTFDPDIELKYKDLEQFDDNLQNRVNFQVKLKEEVLLSSERRNENTIKGLKEESHWME